MSVLRNIMRNLITEASESKEEIYKKLYKDIPKNIFDKIIQADPTSNEEKMGSYSNWLLNLYKNGKLKTEDLYKATDYLNVYDENRNIFPRIGNVKDLQQLYKILSDGGKIKVDKASAGEIKPEKNIIVHYKDDTWALITPLTEEASCKYGKGTQWCTAATKSDNAFEDYNEQGYLYILINRKTNNKWQFHFETNSFMDENDNAVNDYIIKKIYTALPKELQEILDILTKENSSREIEYDEIFYPPYNEHKYLSGELDMDVNFPEFNLSDFVYTIKSLNKFIGYDSGLDEDVMDEDFEGDIDKYVQSEDFELYNKLLITFEGAYFELIHEYFEIKIKNELKINGITYKIHETKDSSYPIYTVLFESFTDFWNYELERIEIEFDYEPSSNEVAKRMKEMLQENN